MTHALILAAGQGTRLAPLTNDRPKCLVPLLGRTILERQADVFKECGIHNVRVVTGYCAEKIANLGYATAHNPRFATTNMVESLFAAKAHLTPGDDLLISYGDIVYHPSNLKAVLSHKAEITLMIDLLWRQLWEMRAEDPLKDAETLVMDNRGNILELGKKPKDFSKIQGQYTGLIKVRGDKVTALIDFYQKLDRQVQYDGQPFEKMYMTSFLQSLIDAKWQVQAAKVEGGWLEVDTLDDLKIYEKAATSGLLQRLCKVV